MRFIEPQIIVTHHQNIDVDFITENDAPITMVLIADIHLGPYKSINFLNRAIKKINALKPDLVIIAGDFLYAPKLKQIPQLLAPLANINAPIYAVSGNHDYDNAEYIQQLKTHLPKSIKLLSDKIIKVTIKNKELTIIGLNDLWDGNPNNDLLHQAPPNQNTIAIVHNPDHIKDLTNANIDLVVSGHTHGGQIRIPFLYKMAIPSDFGYDWGYNKEPHTQLYITSGLGETALPMRFLQPPQIVVLTLC
ncbi:hypothetical protein COV81_04365 [Candidatus Peregrinibacteria bacterium CG11_big_fil_rev_8_21_14_0_20_41_10]|nr:MAG: hypothetical protein COV81_04365 [Candidatus Peregrinibacteria bacterium CG11_big_fil_rev_8_21_14_0_20_41_10]PIZ76839.1 MAG: hypothetical protein COY06_01280 [Candidatus Peregrinibacteria bacterium CG_4_10_14_0_2_um_filter_41_8]PJC38012.1 MAG: hypothetical protein CO045_02495 [Candidatus Peregrinibacteria bacterium CG_4_9_14_0_2_um_filter_41_14]